MKYRIVFTDLDGTLFDNQKQIGEKTREMAKELNRQGIPLVPVSARMPRAIQPVVEMLGVPAPMICFNGGLLLDAEGRTISAEPIPHEVAARVLQAIDRAKEEYGFFMAKSIYTEDQWLTEEPETRQAQREAWVLKVEPVKVSYDEVLRSDEPIYKLTCSTSEDKVPETKELEQKLAEMFPELSVHCSARWYMEICSEKATKGNGLRQMCRHLGIPLEESIAIGDYYNDLEMMETAGFSVAMANAPAEVKAIADDVTEKTNNEEGVAEYLLPHLR